MENEWGDDPFQAIVDTIAMLQGTQAADGALLYAMLISHPDPKALLDAWHRVIAPKVARQATTEALGGLSTTSDRDRKEAIERWSRRLEQLAQQAPDRRPPASPNGA